MGKNGLIMKNAGKIRTPVDAFRKKMKIRDKMKKKEKKDFNTNNNDQKSKFTIETPESHLQTLGFGNFYNSKQNQIASINPDLLEESKKKKLIIKINIDYDTIHDLLTKKKIDANELKKKEHEIIQNRINLVGSHNMNDNSKGIKKKNENKNKINNEKYKKNSQDPLFMVTMKEDYNPIAGKKENEKKNQQLGKYANLNNVSNYYQRDLTEIPLRQEENTQPQAIISKGAELVGKSKIDVSKEKILFVPHSLKKKENDTEIDQNQINKTFFPLIPNFKNTSNVPVPQSFIPKIIQKSDQKPDPKLLAFLAEIDKLN